MLVGLRTRAVVWLLGRRASYIFSQLLRERLLGKPLWRRLPHRVAREHLHVVGALEGSGLRHRIAAHAALHLLDGIVLMLAHPHQQLGGDGIEEGDAAIAWTVGGGPRSTSGSVMAVLRHAGAAWTAQQIVASGAHVSADHAGIAGNGAVVVTWESYDAVCKKYGCVLSSFVLHASRQNADRKSTRLNS